MLPNYLLEKLINDFKSHAEGFDKELKQSKDNGSKEYDDFNLARALYSICLEIKAIKDFQALLPSLIQEEIDERIKNED